MRKISLLLPSIFRPRVSVGPYILQKIAENPGRIPGRAIAINWKEYQWLTHAR